MNSGKLTQPFRKAGLMHWVDNAKFAYHSIRNRGVNRQFLAKNPHVKLPPDYLMYESYRLNYRKYYEGGLDNAVWLKNHFEKYIDLSEKRILDWGCGPARVVRHLSKVFPGCEIHGTDYNQKTIDWCSKNIENVVFSHNGINPPLSYESDFFDMIYGISIFTHLSELNHKSWYEELIRVSRNDAILLLTTQGEATKAKMTESERQTFDSGKIVIRGQVKEGHRVYAAFHPPKFIRELFGSKAEILEHIPGKKEVWGIGQDVWIVKKN